MPTVTASIGITIETWEKCRLYKINRSAIARAAIEKEVERIENEIGVIAGKQDTPNTPQGGMGNVTR